MNERIKRLLKAGIERGERGAVRRYNNDLHHAAKHIYAHLPHTKRVAYATAFAIENQAVVAYEDDGIGGRVYHGKEAPIEDYCADLNNYDLPQKTFLSRHPEWAAYEKFNIVGHTAFGHIGWNYKIILEKGVEGLKTEIKERLAATTDEKSVDYYENTLVLLDALLAFNDKHIKAYEDLGNRELAERMKRVPRYGAQSFEDAVQAFFMQHIVVMNENPFGGNGPGWLDRYLWPFLKADLEKGVITIEKAREIIDELFIRMDEPIHNMDTWVEAIVAGGTDENGNSAVNPLTYIMIESFMELGLTHPPVYVRLPENPPDELIKLAVKFIKEGNNRAQILNDKAIIAALMNEGKPFSDAVRYMCGGCMEVSPQGTTSDLLFMGWQNVPKMLELMLTDGVCLIEGEKYPVFNRGGLTAFDRFEDFYAAFFDEIKKAVTLLGELQDLYSERLEYSRPAYLLSSMLDDCLERGRAMHAGGARYHDYGFAPVGWGCTADSLYAVKKAVFDDKICSADELLDALKCNFEGYGRLQSKLRNIPKYGEDNDEADEFTSRFISDYCDAIYSVKTRFGGTLKPVVLTFRYAPEVAKWAGASADGRNAHAFPSHGVTPATASMKCGITAAINSCTKINFGKIGGAASSMWDLDPGFVSSEVIEAVLKAFIKGGGQIFQGNVTAVEELLKARENPSEYPNLIVRVGGYSDHFVRLTPQLMDDVINRMRHKN